jgi:hypothetical protein
MPNDKELLELSWLDMVSGKYSVRYEARRK